MTSAEYTAMLRSYQDAQNMMARLQHWRLSPQTREMVRKAYDLRRGSHYQGAVEQIAQVLEEGRAFAEGYDIPSIRPYDLQQQGGEVTKLFAQPFTIEADHYLDKEQEIIYCAGDTFRIVGCDVKTLKDEPIRCVSGDMLVYQGLPVKEDETGETIEAPWENLDLLNSRKFSIYKPFLDLSSRWISNEDVCSHSL